MFEILFPIAGPIDHHIPFLGDRNTDDLVATGYVRSKRNNNVLTRDNPHILKRNTKIITSHQQRYGRKQPPIVYRYKRIPTDYPVTIRHGLGIGNPLASGDKILDWWFNIVEQIQGSGTQVRGCLIESFRKF